MFNDILKGGVGWIRDGDMSSLLLTDGEQGGALDSRFSTIERAWSVFLGENFWRNTVDVSKFQVQDSIQAPEKDWCFKMFWLKRFQLLPPLRALFGENFGCAEVLQADEEQQRKSGKLRSGHYSSTNRLGLKWKKCTGRLQNSWKLVKSLSDDFDVSNARLQSFCPGDLVIWSVTKVPCSFKNFGEDVFGQE